MEIVSTHWQYNAKNAHHSLNTLVMGVKPAQLFIKAMTPKTPLEAVLTLMFTWTFLQINVFTWTRNSHSFSATQSRQYPLELWKRPAGRGGGALGTDQIWCGKTFPLILSSSWSSMSHFFCTSSSSTSLSFLYFLYIFQILFTYFPSLLTVVSAAIPPISLSPWLILSLPPTLFLPLILVFFSSSWVCVQVLGQFEPSGTGRALASY